MLHFPALREQKSGTLDNLDSALKQGNQLHNSLRTDKSLDPEDWPVLAVHIIDCDIGIEFNFNTYRILHQTIKRKENPENIISENISENGGFLMWIEKHTFAVVFQQVLRKGKKASEKLLSMDSHCRNDSSHVANIGAPSLLSFNNEINFVGYLMMLNLDGHACTSYRLQLIKCYCYAINSCMKSIMSKHISCEKRDARNRKRKSAYKDKTSTPKKQMWAPQLKDCISSFESKIEEGSYFIQYWPFVT